MRLDFNFIIGVSWILATLFAVFTSIGIILYIIDNKKTAYRFFKIAAVLLGLTLFYAFCVKESTELLFHIQ